MNTNSGNQESHNLLPSPPEDQLILLGDIASLFLYTFLDHTINNDIYATMMLSPDNAAAVMEDASPPVWFEILHSLQSPEQIMALVRMTPYVDAAHCAPLLSQAGMASIAMTSCWLGCGYLTGAFFIS